MDFIEKVKGFLMEPSKVFEALKDETLEEAVKYYIGLAAIYSLLSAIMFAFLSTMIDSILGKYGISMGVGIDDTISNFFMSLIQMIIGVFLVGAALHAFVYMLGGRRDIRLTIKALMYSSTPIVLLGWIPLIGIIGWIWLFALCIVGIQQYQEIATGRVIAAVVTPIIILFLLVIALIAAIAPLVFSSGLSS